MLKNKTIVCVIPARLSSTRFPRKMLALLSGKPLIQWAFERACQVSFFDEVAIAVDSYELYEVVTSFGAKAFVTSLDCANGTDRLCELKRQKKLQGEIWVNWQGDEPFLKEETMHTLLQSIENPLEEIWTLKKKIHKAEEVHSPHVVKVVCDKQGRALYFSRSTIPSDPDNAIVYKHIGLYAFSETALEKIASLSPCQLELQEKLEQLRFLYHGMCIQVHETTEEIFGIDTKEQLAIAQEMCYY